MAGRRASHTAGVWGTAVTGSEEPPPRQPPSARLTASVAVVRIMAALLLYLLRGLVRPPDDHRVGLHVGVLLFRPAKFALDIDVIVPASEHLEEARKERGGQLQDSGEHGIPRVKMSA